MSNEPQSSREWLHRFRKLDEEFGRFLLEHFPAVTPDMPIPSGERVSAEILDEYLRREADGEPDGRGMVR